MIFSIVFLHNLFHISFLPGRFGSPSTSWNLWAWFNWNSNCHCFCLLKFFGIEDNIRHLLCCTLVFYAFTQMFSSLRLMWWEQLLKPVVTSASLARTDQPWPVRASHCNIHDLIIQGEVSVRNCNVWFNLLSRAIKGRRVNLSGNRLSTLGSVPQFPSLCPGGYGEREHITHTHTDT